MSDKENLIFKKYNNLTNSHYTHLLREYDSVENTYTLKFLYVNKENIGMIGNWNRGFELANTKYVAMLHDDDMLADIYLEEINRKRYYEINFYNYRQLEID